MAGCSSRNGISRGQAPILPEPNFRNRTLYHGDNPHISSSSAGDKDVASAHGWWETSTGHQCPSHAYVAVWLDAFVCYYDGDHRVRCLWPENYHDQERRRPGSDSAYRVNVRKKCAHNDKEITFMSVIDVDLIGVWDRPGQRYTISVEGLTILTQGSILSRLP